MLLYSDGGSLQEAYKRQRIDETNRCRCSQCRTVFVDDVPNYGSLRCPNCGNILFRGLSWEEARNLLNGCKE